jgi:site-specific recombinase XerD
MLHRRAAKAGLEKRVHPHALRHASLATTAVYLDHIAPVDVIELGRADEWRDE